MSNPNELPDLVEAVRKLVRAKGRFHTEQNYKELADALARYEARRAQPEGEASQADALYRQYWAQWPPLCGAQHAESGKESGSIEDYNEFNRLLDLYCDSQADNYAALVAYIDKWADRRAAQLEGGQGEGGSHG